MKQQTPPIDELIKQYIPSWEKRRREAAARENNSAQPGNSKPPAHAEPESVKQAEVHYVYKYDSDTGMQDGMLKMKHAYTWLKDANLMPVPEMLFDEFWREGELCIVYSDADIDKSVLAVQIADSISKGLASGPFNMQSKEQPVLYFDFELSAKQFEGRYSKDYKQHYQFHPNFVRLEMNPDFADNGQTSFEDNIVTSIEQAIEKSDAKVLIIDNLTWLAENMGKASKTQMLMVKLNQLKIKYGLSILLLATTDVKPGKPITRAVVQKRNGLLNLCDSAFCIGESTIAPNRFYLKQLRCSASELVYTKDNVCVCEIKKESNFKQFVFLQYSNERTELLSQKHRQHYTDYLKIMELKKQGSSNVEIARKYGVTEGSVRLWLKRGEEKYGANATSTTMLRHAVPIDIGIISASDVRETLKQVQGDGSATNPTRGYHPPAPSLEEEGGGDVWSDENATNHTNDTRISTADLRLAPLAFGEGPGVRLGKEDATNATNPTSGEHGNSTERELLTAAA